MVKSQTTKEVQKEADALLAAVAGKLNQIDVYPVTVGDVRRVLAQALAERLGPAGGVCIVWWDEANGLQINVAGTK